MTADLADDVAPCVFDNAGDVLEACELIRERLGHAAKRGDIPAILGCRAAAEDVRAAVRAARLQADSRLAVAELLRRCERAFGVALRRGQDDGTIHAPGRRGPATAGLPCATDYASRNDLYAGGNGRSAGIYDLVDGITDEAFAAALAAGRASGNLSRVGMARRLGTGRVAASTPARGEGIPDSGDRSFAAIGRRLDVIREMADGGSTSEQIADVIGRTSGYIRDLARGEGIVISGDEVTRKGRSHDSRRIVGETVAALEGLAMGVRPVDLGDLDPALIQDWVTSLTRSLPVLTRLKRDLIKEITQ